MVEGGAADVGRRLPVLRQREDLLGGGLIALTSKLQPWAALMAIWVGPDKTTAHGGVGDWREDGKQPGRGRGFLLSPATGPNRGITVDLDALRADLCTAPTQSAIVGMSDPLQSLPPSLAT